MVPEVKVMVRGTTGHFNNATRTVQEIKTENDFEAKTLENSKNN
jgi:hypothetical protein